jgi:putative intracellular protease/amidase
VEYITHLWGNKEPKFTGNADEGVITERVAVKTEVNDVEPTDYKGIILIGAYAMDRLRYQTKVKKGQKNQAPAVNFLRRALKNEHVKVGTICHSLWLLCADREMLEGRKVTCAHNIICDVENAGGEVVYNGDEAADLVIDGNLICAKHPAVVDEFMGTFIKEIEKA